MGRVDAENGRRRDKDIVLDRNDEGEVHASLPWRVHHYGVETLDWGYIGPAPAELALNILNWLLPPGIDGEAPIACDRGECSAVSWRLHRSFMAEYLVRMPISGGCLQEQEIRHWVLEQIDAATAPATENRRGWFNALLTR